MTSINNLNHKVTLLERKVSYGTNGGITVNGGLLSVDISNNGNAVRIKDGQLSFTGSNKLKDGGIFISKDAPYPSTITGPNRTRLSNMVMIGGSIDISNGVQQYVDYSTIIHGSVAGDVNGDSSNNCIVGYGSRMNAYGRSNATALGTYAYCLESDSVAVGYTSKASQGGVAVGSQAGLDISLTSGLLYGYNNTFIGYNSGRGIITGRNNIALGFNSRFSGDVSNCLSINNQNTAIGGIYGTNLGLNTFALGLNNNSPTSPLDISGNFLRVRNTTTPASSADTIGNIGDIAWDVNYVYVKTSTGWKRSGLGVF
jgi:hypothetical protein